MGPVNKTLGKNSEKKATPVLERVKGFISVLGWC